MTLVEWLAKHPEVVHTNTPLEVLASHMLHSLALFESTLIARASHDFFKPGYENAPNSPSLPDAPAGGFSATGDSLYGGSPYGACPVCEDE